MRARGCDVAAGVRNGAASPCAADVAAAWTALALTPASAPGSLTLGTGDAEGEDADEAQVSCRSSALARSLALSRTEASLRCSLIHGETWRTLTQTTTSARGGPARTRARVRTGVMWKPRQGPPRRGDAKLRPTSQGRRRHLRLECKGVPVTRVPPQGMNKFDLT